MRGSSKKTGPGSPSSASASRGDDEYCPTLLELGSPWCGHCRRAQPLIAEAFTGHPQVRHLKIADASGKRLGRSFGVKLWPTLVFLSDGKELARLVRPSDPRKISEALALID